jgi:hypothetical protein
LPRKDPFRTLDDPEPEPTPAPCSVPAGAIAAGTVSGAFDIAAPQWLKLGALRVPLRRPGWLRRLIVRLVLGWRYDDLKGR